MSIAATANYNFAALSPTLNVASSPAGKSGATIIADIVARILQAGSESAQTSGSAQTPAVNSSVGIILTQLLGSTNGAASMELNLNQLLNSVVLPKATAQLPPELLARPQVIEALVLQNTLLPDTLLPATSDNEQSALPLLILPSPANSASASTTLYRVNIEWQNKLIQLLSSQPLPTGTRVPLQIDSRGAITLLRPEIAAKILLAQKTAENISAAPAPTTPTSAQTIQQSLRELLPRQQALHSLVPMLQKFIAPAAREQLPPPIFKALAQLLQSLPKSSQLTSPENLKQALNNSGSFFEARLTQALMGKTATGDAAETLPKILAGDLKAQIGALLELVHKFAPATAPSTADMTRASGMNSDDDFVYTAKTLLQQNAAHAAQNNSVDDMDALIKQLGKLLEAGFARIQLNQLDSASVRHAAHETQTPVPTWVLELPLRTPHGVDQLQLRIEQRRKQQAQNARVQWNVEIAFDLHAAGKFAASLAIIDKSVSATLWAEREQTHRRVREEMDYLRAGLESVGVNVTEMQCRLGLPAPRVNPISQQLVDVHT